MLEKEIENYLCWVVEMRGGKAWKWVSPSQRGVADRIVVLPGGTIWMIELKSPTGKRSKLQVEFAAKVAMLGVNYACLGTKSEVDGWALSL